MPPARAHAKPFFFVERRRNGTGQRESKLQPAQASASTIKSPNAVSPGEPNRKAIVRPVTAWSSLVTAVRAADARARAGPGWTSGTLQEDHDA